MDLGLSHIGRAWAVTKSSSWKKETAKDYAAEHLYYTMKIDMIYRL